MTRFIALGIVVSGLFGSGCDKAAPPTTDQSQQGSTAQSQTGTAQPQKEGTMQLTSSAFAPGGSIPQKHTCQGHNASPPLAWSGAPEKTNSFVLIVDDPDAPDPAAPQRTWVHWVLYDIPATTTSLPESVKSLPSGTRQGTNDWKRTGYGGPCPPVGRHRYFFKLYALDTSLGDLGQPNKAAVEGAMKGHVLEKAELIGTYEKTE